MTATLTDNQVAEEVPEEPARPPRRWRVDLAGYAGYLAAAVWVGKGLWQDVNHRALSYNVGDHTFFQWLLAYGAKVARGGAGPLYTDLMNAPDGVNLMANTAVLGIGVPLAPITMWFGPQVSYAVMMTLAMGGTAAAWYWLFSRLVVSSRLAAFVGGLVCGFSPGIVAHASGQANISTQFLVPIMLWCTVKLTERPVKYGLLLAGAVAYQTFINEEILLLAAGGIGMFVLLYAAFDRSRVRRDWRKALLGLGICAVVAGALLAYPLYQQFFGPQHYRGLPFAATRFSLDVSAYPAYARESVGAVNARAVVRPAANEENAEFGWPLIVLALVIIGWLWRDRRYGKATRAAAITAVVATIMSFGPEPLYADRPVKLWTPTEWLVKVPPFDLLVMGRVALLVAPVIGLLLAMALQRTADVAPRATGLPWRPLTAAAILAVLVPVAPTPLPTEVRPPIPEFISAGLWRPYVPAGRTLVSVPLPGYRTSEPIRWQATQGLEYAIPRGYFLGPNGYPSRTATFGAPGRPTSNLLYRIAVAPQQPNRDPADTPLSFLRNGTVNAKKWATITDADRANARADLTYWRAAIVVLAPQKNDEALYKAVTALLGFPPTWIGGIWLWDVRGLVS